MAHIHSRLPRHCAPQRKKPLLFPRAGEGEKVSGVNRRSAPPPKKKRGKKEKGTGLPTPVQRRLHSLPASAHKHRAHQFCQHCSCDCLFLQPNWVSLRCCIEDVSNNELAVNARALTVSQVEEFCLILHVEVVKSLCSPAIKKKINKHKFKFEYFILGLCPMSCY